MTAEMARMHELVGDALERGGPIVALTGAGISAESGIPTFRGEEGYWTVGSRHYHPTELATKSAFLEIPEEVWAWYLYRRGVCRAARPNAAHLALAELDARLGDRFRLVTQNVDGLHLRAGNTPERTFEIHGNIDFARCEDRWPERHPIPEGIPVDWPKARKLTESEQTLLRDCSAGGWSRPHVLWFDESYDEELFRFQSSIEVMRAASMLIVIGTSGATNLPTQMVSLAVHRGIPLVVVNRDESSYTQAADRAPRGLTLRGTATAYVPPLARALLQCAPR